MFFVPLPIILKSLIECSDKTIYQSITEGRNDPFVCDRVLAMLKYSSETDVNTNESARDYLGAHFKRVIGAPQHFTNERVYKLLVDRYLFPHLTGKPLSAKYDLLIFMTN